MEDFSSNGPADLLQQGLAAAKSGDVGLAKTLFLKAADEDPAMEIVWICLSAIEPQLPARLKYLRRAILNNPASATALAMIKAARKQLSQTLVEQATKDFESGNRDDAQNIFLAAVELDPENTQAATQLWELAASEIKQVASSAVIAQSPLVAPAPELDTHIIEENSPLDDLRLEEHPITLDASAFEQSEPVAPEVFPQPSTSQTCLFCLSHLTGSHDSSCQTCGGIQVLFDPRENDDAQTERIDQRQILSAVERIELKLRSNPDDSELHYALGLAYLNLSQLNAALDSLNRSQQLNPRILLDQEIGRLSITSEEPETAVAPDENEQPVADSDNEDSEKPKVILIGEDSATMRKLVSGALEKEGYIVLTAGDGTEALAKFHEAPVDLVLLDVVLPDMDGYQVCRTIRAADKGLPIVLLSAKDGFFDKVRGKVAGATAYITKPFLREELIASVQQLCPLNSHQETFQ